MLDSVLAVAVCCHSAVALEMLAGKQAEKAFDEFHEILLKHGRAGELSSIC
jgi:hypothetical protein